LSVFTEIVRLSWQHLTLQIFGKYNMGLSYISCYRVLDLVETHLAVDLNIL